MVGIGRFLLFHGAFGSKRKAVRKERREKGDFILDRKVKGHRRFIVASPK